MNFLESVIEKINGKIAKTGIKKSLVLPESTDIRTLKAISILSKKDWLNKIYTIGSAEAIRKLEKENNIDLSKVEIIDIETSKDSEKYAEIFYELRKAKGMTKEEAQKTLKNPLYYGAMMLKENVVDGMVAGAINTTGDVLKSAILTVKTAPGISKVSSCFAMLTNKKEYGLDGKFVFADCAVIPDPDSETLVDIAISSARTFQALFDAKPIIAFLSFSTKGSAKHPMVDKVQAAVKLAQEKYPDYEIDGELQLDAAIVTSVGAQKAPGSKVAGRANVLVFPDLNAANIGYKLVQRLAGAEAFGPIIQGLAKPVNDLSRGCSVDDIVNVAAITTLNSY